MKEESGRTAKRLHLAQAGIVCLPKSWTVIEVGDILSDDRGISVGVMYPGSNDPFGVPLIRGGDLNGNSINQFPEFRITPQKHEEYRRTALEGGELLLSLVGGLGQCAVVPNWMAGWNAARAVAVIRLKDSSDAQFLRLCLLSKPLQYIMNAWATTTVQATLNLKEIKQLPIPWPPKPERQAIVRTLVGLEDRSGLNYRMNETLEAMARAIFKSWFVDFDPVRANAEGRQPFGKDAETAALFPDSFEDSPLGKIPKGWRVSPIGEIVNTVGGSTPRTEEPKFWNGEINFCTPKDMASLRSPVLLDTERRITQAGLQQISSGLLPMGTVLLSSRAPIGYLAVAEIPVTVNQGIIAMICGKELPHLYVLNWAKENMGTIVAHANGTTFLEISKKNFRPIETLVPPKQVLERFTDTVSPLYKRILSNLLESKTLVSIRDALLPKLISGDIRVKNIENTTASVS
jgi:type I restriction enzyme S subunit